MDNARETADRGFISRAVKAETIVTLAGMLVGFGVIYGTTKYRIESNTESIGKIAISATADRQFHVGQRERIWDRVDKIEDQQARISERLAAIEAVTRQTNDMVETLLQLQLERKAKQ